MKRRLLLWLKAVVLTLGVFVTIYAGVLRPWHLHWGATPAEVHAALPGDEFILNAKGGDPGHHHQRAAGEGLALVDADRAGSQRFLQLHVPGEPGGLRHA